ncbi:GNAT family N-acetyltransferase [Ostreiculturibacter nitratireducens]|uniref:GNAT family N-acetyltransferase n=1 Tax=Ostreiculturibacter nitratireducens TaxID=3075226 RepID=UPI0031B585B4
MREYDNCRFGARFAEGAEDIARAQRLRWLAFRAGNGAAGRDGLDADAFDPLCRHVLIEETRSGALVACFRLLPLARGAEIGRSYAAQYYDLSGLLDFDGPMAEMGRFCLHPDWHDPDILRVAWAATTRFVDEEGIEMLFGCSSFAGTEAEVYVDAFAMLKERHLGPRRWLPRVKAPDVVRFARNLSGRRPDLKRALKAMPPLLRTYLTMGGWVSDHAVVDTEMATLHVFTGLEIRAVPSGRARALRAIAGTGPAMARGGGIRA